MHPNIDAEEGLEALLISYETKLVTCTKILSIKQLIRALHLLMKHDVFRFGITYDQRKGGAAIRNRPLTCWTAQIHAFYEMIVLQDLFVNYLRLDKKV